MKKRIHQTGEYNLVVIVGILGLLLTFISWLLIKDKNKALSIVEKKESELRKRFIRELQIRNYSHRTINSYVCSLISITKYFNLSPDVISSEQFKDYLHNLVENKKVSISAINQMISAFKILQQDVLGNDWEEIRIKRPRGEHKLPVVLSKDEVEKLIQSAENIKHKAIIALAYSSGWPKC